MNSPPSSGSDHEPDYRFTLANERTFLSYVRTALALEGAGLAVAQFLTVIGSRRLRDAAGMLLISAGLAVIVAGFVRWKSVQAAMRIDAPLPTTAIPLVLTIVLGAGAVAAIVALALH